MAYCGFYNLFLRFGPMHLTLRQLRVFEAVATHLSHTKAANALFLTQPAVSIQIKQLEESIGLHLFERIGKRILLTQAGQELHRYAKNVFYELDQAAEVMEGLKGVRQGRLHIAVASTVNYFAPRALAAFHKRFPGIELQLDVDNRRSLIKALDENQVDMVMMGKPPESIGLVAEAFMRNPLVVVAPPEHPLTRERGIPLQRLSEEVFLVREEGSGTQMATDRFFETRGVAYKKGMMMTRNEAIKQGVRWGLGLGVVSQHSLELEQATGKLMVLDAEGFPLERKWFLVYRSGKILSPSARAFHAFLLGDGLAACQCLEWAV